MQHVEKSKVFPNSKTESFLDFIESCRELNLTSNLLRLITNYPLNAGASFHLSAQCLRRSLVQHHDAGLGRETVQCIPRRGKPPASSDTYQLELPSNFYFHLKHVGIVLNSHARLIAQFGVTIMGQDLGPQL